jgi:hypothetical protein
MRLEGIDMDELGEKTDSIVSVLRDDYKLPGEGLSAAGVASDRTLLRGERWDEVDRDSLLRLKETTPINPEVGYRLRHYWIPATELTYHASSELLARDQPPMRIETETRRSMAKCQADHIIWRERSNSVFYVGISMLPMVSPFVEPGDVLFYYHRGKQTLRERQVPRRDKPAPEDAVEARRKALGTLPFIHPFQPLQIGDSWTVSAGEDSMTYRFDAVDRVGDTGVAFISREGRYTLRSPLMTPAGPETVDVTVERQGLTVFAYNRSVVLEDRVRDRFIGASRDPDSYVGTETRTVMRLMRSVPRERDG